MKQHARNERRDGVVKEIQEEKVERPKRNQVTNSLYRNSFVMKTLLKFKSLLTRPSVTVTEADR